MTDKYDSIIDIPRYEPSKHKRMGVHERAAQFMPFAAISFGASNDEAARLTCPKIELDEAEIGVINERLRTLSGTVKLTYFIPDSTKPGGRYETGTHTVKKTDPFAKTVLFADGLKIRFEDIYSFDD